MWHFFVCVIACIGVSGYDGYTVWLRTPDIKSFWVVIILENKLPGKKISISQLMWQYSHVMGSYTGYKCVLSRNNIGKKLPVLGKFWFLSSCDTHLTVWDRTPDINAFWVVTTLEKVTSARKILISQLMWHLSHGKGLYIGYKCVLSRNNIGKKVTSARTISISQLMWHLFHGMGPYTGYKCVLSRNNNENKVTKGRNNSSSQLMWH
jgi:hypothetical protein